PASVPFAAMSSVGNNSRFLRMRTIILTALITYGCGERAPTPTEPASASHREQAPLLGAPGPGGATSGSSGATSGPVGATSESGGATSGPVGATSGSGGATNRLIGTTSGSTSQ